MEFCKNTAPVDMSELYGPFLELVPAGGRILDAGCGSGRDSLAFLQRGFSVWHMDETFVRIAGRWLCLFRALDSQGQTVDFYLSETRDREAAKCFLKKALANPDNRPPRVFARDGLRSYPAAIRELHGEGQLRPRCRHRTRRYADNRIESDHRSIKRRLRAMQGPRTVATARIVIQAIEAVHMIRKGQVLGITRHNLHGQAWVFGALLGIR